MFLHLPNEQELPENLNRILLAVNGSYYQGMPVSLLIIVLLNKKLPVPLIMHSQ